MLSYVEQWLTNIPDPNNRQAAQEHLEQLAYINQHGGSYENALARNQNEPIKRGGLPIYILK